MSKIAIILTQQFADWEYALLAGTGGPYYGLDIRFFAPEAGEIQSMGGLRVSIPEGLDAINSWMCADSPQRHAQDNIVVCGGLIWSGNDAPDISALLSEHYDNGGTVAGICGGTLALARAGLLNTTPHTSNDMDFLRDNVRAYTGMNNFRQQSAAVSASRVITAAGTAPVTFTAAIFEAAGIDNMGIQQLTGRMAAEHLPDPR